jgi:hypothetical protein
VTLGQAIVGLVVSPVEAMRELARAGSYRRAAVIVACWAACWAALFLALDARGHAPSGPLLVPIARERYYVAEAILIGPLFLVGLAALTLVARAVGGALGARATRLDPSATATTAAAALAVPSILAWVLPDAVVYATLDFDAIAPAMRVYAPVSLLWTLALLTLALRASEGLPTWRAFATALAALAAETAVVGLVWR